MTQGYFISRSRIYAVIVVVCLVWVMVVARLINFQLVQGDRFLAITDMQSKGTIDVPADRGRVLDCKGRVLAGNVATRSFFAYPATKEEALALADAIAEITPESRRHWRDQLSGRVESFSWIERKLTDSLAAAYARIKAPGIYSQKESKRVYPTNGLGRDLLGVVDVDNHGISGLEFALNETLEGEPGQTRVERDAVGKVYRVASKDLIEPKNGKDVELTIDLDWQAIVESELKRGVDTFSAEAGMVVFLRPHDGAVLAMASYNPRSNAAASQKNEVISDLFEPGSVFKLVTAVAALEEGTAKPTDVYYCGEGKYKFSGRTIHDDKKWDTLSFHRIFTVSSNIGVGRIACDMGPKNLYKYARYFGFGLRTGIDLPGEMAGQLREPEVWSDFFAASLAMGHGVSVTALQLAAAFNVVASDGVLYEPYIIRKVTDADGNVVAQGQPHAVRKIASPETCAIMKRFMKSVVDTGTAVYAKSNLITFAGKTGTAQKPNLQSGGYYQNRYVSSFAGHFPAEDPIAVGVVVLNDPQPLHYAGMTAGRIFKRIAERVAALERIAMPLANQAIAAAEVKLVEVPDLRGYALEDARKSLKKLPLEVSYVNDGDVVSKQIPAPGTKLREGERLIVHLRERSGKEHLSYAELVGLPVRSAVDKLVKQGREFTIEGSGFVKSVVTVGGDQQASGRIKLICGIS